MRCADPIPDLKRQVAAELAVLMDAYNTTEAAAIMKTDRWRIADIRAGRLERFSLETLLRFAARMHLDTDLHLQRRATRRRFPSRK